MRFTFYRRGARDVQDASVRFTVDLSLLALIVVLAAVLGLLAWQAGVLFAVGFLTGVGFVLVALERGART
jgi:hypothetical protein